MNSPAKGVPAKPVYKRAVWVEKPERSKAPVCACGNKYLKTRLNQKQCIKCIYKSKESGVR